MITDPKPCSPPPRTWAWQGPQLPPRQGPSECQSSAGECRRAGGVSGSYGRQQAAPQLENSNKIRYLNLNVDYHIIIYKKGDNSSVADPGCLSRSRIPDPDFYPSRVPDPDFYPSRLPDPGSKNSCKREG
jgi:hypothetical protein